MISKTAKFDLDDEKESYENNLKKLDDLKLKKLCLEKNKNDLKPGETMKDLVPVTLHVNESMINRDKLENMKNKVNTNDKINKEISIKKITAPYNTFSKIWKNVSNTCKKSFST